ERGPANNEMKLTGGEGGAHDGWAPRARIIIERRPQLISVLGGPQRTPMTLASITTALLLTTAASAFAQTRIDKTGARRRVVEQIGRTVVDCGTFPGQPYLKARALPSGPLKQVSQCMTSAWRERKPFFFAVDGSAIDSWVATGLMGTSKGAIKVFWYD